MLSLFSASARNIAKFRPNYLKGVLKTFRPSIIENSFSTDADKTKDLQQGYAVIRAGYKISTENVKLEFVKIPSSHHKILEKNHPITDEITENFNSTRNKVGHYYKIKTAELSEESIELIYIRNLQKYRNKLGPTAKFLREGPTPELDESVKKVLREEYGLSDSKIKMDHIEKEMLKNNLQIILSSFKIKVADLNLQDPKFLALLETEKSKIKSLPSDVQEILEDLKEAVYAYVNDPAVRHIVEDFDKLKS